MTVAIIDYGSGNLHSAVKAFERASSESGACAQISLTSDPDMVRGAERIVLPGVGAFADCFTGLSAIDGMLDALNESVRVDGKPFLGICVGMQLLAQRGLEHGDWPGLGWIEGEVKLISPKVSLNGTHLKIPHMGWNTLNVSRPHPLLAGIPIGDDGLHAYFVHSYHFITHSADDMIAETDYGGLVTAIVGRGNIAGVQFHPEKSQRLGLKLIENFLRWRP
ncbi:MAG: imidazole glycerol phosphate synthase subunit HisH [Hyphomicrobiales bacterium]|nr:imidazole glycerol phosphate synthase subunit HisH [Hyphomicrobiales bacterium]